MNQQIETNHSMQDKLHGDLEHKDMALEIDRDCHEMHNDAIDIKHHDGIEEEDVSGSVPQSWAKFSKNNVEESQGEFSRFRWSLSCNPPLQAAGRSATRQLRYDVNNLINNAASDMSVHWNKTNRAFTDRLASPLKTASDKYFRISECQDAHRNLKSNLILTKNVSSFHLFLEAHPHLGHLGCWTINKDIVENSKTCHTESQHLLLWQLLLVQDICTVLTRSISPASLKLLYRMCPQGVRLCCI